MNKIIFTSPLFYFFSFLTYWFTLFFALVFNKLFFGLKIRGRRNIDKIQGCGCFLISNHSLYLDPAVISHAIFPRRALFSSSPCHFKVPFFGTYIRLLGGFPIPERMGLVRIAKPIQKAINKGLFIHFFPEGKLNYLSNKIDKFMLGVFSLSYNLNIPILPIIIINRKRKFFKSIVHPHYISLKLVIEKPIYPQKNFDIGKKKRLAIEKMAQAAYKIMSDCIERENI